jgi:hypothetical protein
MPFAPLNAAEGPESAIAWTMEPARLCKVTLNPSGVPEETAEGRQMNAEVKYVLRSKFMETLELENFPFDGPGQRAGETGRESRSGL